MTQRIVAGTVNVGGGKEKGSEFSVSRTSQGHYLISFRPAFSHISGASVTQVYPADGDTRDNAVIIRLNDSELFVKTGDGVGNASDRAFTFIAAGEGSAVASNG